MRKNPILSVLLLTLQPNPSHSINEIIYIRVIANDRQQRLQRQHQCQQDLTLKLTQNNQEKAKEKKKKKNKNRWKLKSRGPQWKTAILFKPDSYTVAHTHTYTQRSTHITSQSVINTHFASFLFFCIQITFPLRFVSIAFPVNFN